MVYYAYCVFSKRVLLVEIIKRSDAKKLGLTNYYTGEPCPKGHLSPRLVSTRNCLECVKIAQKKWRAVDENRLRELSNRNKIRRAHAALHGWCSSERERTRMRNYYRKKAGIPEATRPTPEYCECCANPLNPGKGTHLDHCHKTGIFRGWLCNRCNLGIGHLGDSIKGIERALAYLRRAYGQ